VPVGSRAERVATHGLAQTFGLTAPRRGVSCVAVALALLGVIARPGTASGFVSACAPALRGPDFVRPGHVLAPYLRVVKSSFGLGTCDTPIRVVSRSANGTLWGWDNRNGLWKSTDDLATWHRTYVATNYAQVENVLPLASGHLLIVVRDRRGLYHVLRSMDANGDAFDPVSVLDLPPRARLLATPSWMESAGSIYIAE
jgi:hypothetical protein